MGGNKQKKRKSAPPSGKRKARTDGTGAGGHWAKNRELHEDAAAARAELEDARPTLWAQNYTKAKMKRARDAENVSKWPAGFVNRAPSEWRTNPGPPTGGGYTHEWLHSRFDSRRHRLRGSVVSDHSCS
eukprot:COSAG02_NODE_2044_length_10022_cov_81.942558_8_plen_129_part_00